MAKYIVGVVIVGATGFLHGQQVSRLVRPSEPLKRFLRSHLSLGGDETPDTTTRIIAVSVKSDGKSEEDIVYVSGQDWCGSGGCTMLILKPADSSFKVLGRVTIVQLPIRVLRSMHNGYPDIGVYVQGGGILSGYESVLTFNGKRYSSNPSTPPAQKATATQGKVIIGTTDGSVPLYN
jgi:hypothetical protein